MIQHVLDKPKARCKTSTGITIFTPKIKNTKGGEKWQT